MNNKVWILLLGILFVLNVVVAIVEVYNELWLVASFNVLVALVMAIAILFGRE